MICTDRFAIHPTQMQTILQPECPVYIHCSRRCTDQKSGTSFVQIRMVNRSERLICSVFLRIEGVRADGTAAYLLPEVVLADCNAAPHTVFGEERLTVLGREAVQSLNITVVRVCFADGMLWRKLPGQRVTTAREVGWLPCTCTMLNPPKAEHCALCGRSLSAQEEPVEEPHDAPRLPSPFVPKPAPILRDYEPTLPPVRERRSTAMRTVLAVLSLLALLCVGAVAFYAYRLGVI